MSVSPNNIVLYGSANMVSADGVTTGGAVTFSTRIGFSDFGSTELGAVVSSSASDTTGATGTFIGRDGTGAIQTNTLVLNGVTPVSGSTLFQRVLQGSVAGTLVGDIAFVSVSATLIGTAQSGSNTSGTTAPYILLQSGQGASAAVENIIRITNNTPSGVQNQLRRIVGLNGDTAYVNEDWGTVPTSASTYNIYYGMLFERLPNSVTSIIRIFDNCAADVVGGSSRTFYGKGFTVNNNTTTALTLAGLTVSGTTPALPVSATLEFGWGSGTFNDTATITNRQTFPTAVTLTSGALPVSSGVPAGNLAPSGAAPNTAGALSTWFALTLPAGSQPFDGFASIQVSGTST